MKGLPQSHYFSCKGSMSLIRAVEMAYNEIPVNFTGYQIYRQTLRHYMRPGVYVDTVLRRMRELKGSGIIDYLCTDGIESKYRKA